MSYNPNYPSIIFMIIVSMHTAPCVPSKTQWNFPCNSVTEFLRGRRDSNPPPSDQLHRQESNLLANYVEDLTVYSVYSPPLYASRAISPNSSPDFHKPGLFKNSRTHVTFRHMLHSGKDSNPRVSYDKWFWRPSPSATRSPLCIGECYFPFFAFSLDSFLSVIYCITGRYAISITQCKRLVIHTIQNQVNKKLYITKSVIGTSLLLISLVVNIIVSII